MTGGEGILFGDWEDAFRAGAEVAGGKGWNLGRLHRYGFNVPNGGVLCTHAYREFIESNGLRDCVEEISQEITAENVGDTKIGEKLEATREKIKNGIIPRQDELINRLKALGLADKPLAVRSSASDEDSEKASFAGIHDSFLNVNSLEKILDAIKGCYASLWSPKAVAYRRKMNIPDSEVLPAVVIMEMVEARAAGIAFTCDPRTGREDHIIISANYGLGESVVGGITDPDQYVLDSMSIGPVVVKTVIGAKKHITITDKNGGTRFITEADPQWREFAYNSEQKQVLSNDEIPKLGLVVTRVLESIGEGERHQDIEWAFDGKNFFLVQARPVTCKPRYTYTEIKDQPEIWSNSNTRDAFPMVMSPLSKSLIMANFYKLLDEVDRILGMRNFPGIMPYRFFNGRLYVNCSATQWKYYKEWGSAPADLKYLSGGHQSEITIPDDRKNSPADLVKIHLRRIKLIFFLNRLIKKAEKSSGSIKNHTGQWLQKDLKEIKDKELYSYLQEWSYTTTDSSPMVFVMAMCLGGVLVTLTGFLEKFFQEKGGHLVNSLMAGAAGITSADHGYRLIELAEAAGEDSDVCLFFSSELYDPYKWEAAISDHSPFKKEFRDFIKEYGHRGIYEVDIAHPRWREDPSYLLDTIKNLMGCANNDLLKAEQKNKNAKAWMEITNKVPFYCRPYIKSLLGQLVKTSEIREMTKSDAGRNYEILRKIFLEIENRLLEKGILKQQRDIFYCSFSDILSILKGQWDGRGLSNLVVDRKVRKNELEALSPPDIIVDGSPRYSTPYPSERGNTLTGLGVAAGRASGKARVIMHPEEGGKLGHGEILVAPSTDPAWTPLFLKASAIVMETGGFLSHGAIVAREYGIPAVVNIPGVLRMIKDGQKITVDGDGGKVRLNLS